jgi:hypothetical protein
MVALLSWRRWLLLPCLASALRRYITPVLACSVFFVPQAMLVRCFAAQPIVSQPSLAYVPGQALL